MYREKVIIIMLIYVVVSGCNQSSKKADEVSYVQRKHVKDESIDKLKVNDVMMGKPMHGDWLAEHKEPGQTYEQYMKIKPVTTTRRRNKIYLQPIGELTAVDDSIVANTAFYLKLFFELETIILPVIEDSFVPNSARRINSGSTQLLTGYILNYLETRVPEDAASVMAITPVDLYPANTWNFVFGVARTKKRVGVSSFNRYRPDSLDTPTYSKCLERLIKTSSHEIGHMFGCEHCTYAVCVMNGSNSMKESDSIPNRLCTECLAKLQWNLGFEVKPRLNNLLDFFSKHKLVKDCHYLKADLVLLN